jgi:hypothetical protein
MAEVMAVDRNIKRQHENRPGSNPFTNLSRFIQESIQDPGQEAKLFELSVIKIGQHTPNMKRKTG